MTPDIRPAASDEVAVHTPALRALVELARAAPLPPLRSDADRVHAGFLAARRQQTRRNGILGGLVLAAAAIAFLILRVDLLLSQSAGPSGHVAQDMSATPGDHTAVPRGPALAPGDTRHQLTTEDPASHGPDSADAGPRDLVRRADSLRSAGQPTAAATLLRRVVTDHPSDPLARGALLDLADLQKQLARPDEARCAYRLYLTRYPGAPHLASDVEKALARLGPGPTCDGLTPR